VRDGLSNLTPTSLLLPGGSAIASRFLRFRAALPTSCEQLHLKPDELTFNNYVVQVEQWLKLNAHVRV
jgi:hypothetical protein